MNLYQISQDLFDQLSAPGIDTETGEIDQEAYAKRLESLQLSFDEKALNVAKVIKSLDAETDAIKSAMLNMKDRAEANNKRVAYLESYLVGICSQQNRWPSDAQVKLSSRKSSRVIIDDESKIPAQYTKQELVESIDKKLISQQLKAGESIPGAHIETVANLQIK